MPVCLQSTVSCCPSVSHMRVRRRLRKVASPHKCLSVIFVHLYPQGDGFLSYVTILRHHIHTVDKDQ